MYAMAESTTWLAPRPAARLQAVIGAASTQSHRRLAACQPGRGGVYWAYGHG
jgi:hypothetical protein